MHETQFVYLFKSPLGDYISEKKNIYVDLTSITLTSRLTIYFFDTSSIAKYVKKSPALQTEFRKKINDNTIVIDQQIRKQRLQIFEDPPIWNKICNLNKINHESSTNVFTSLYLLLLFIEQSLKTKATT